MERADVVDRRSEVLPLEEVERRVILDALDAFDGALAPTAQALGIARTTLYRKLRKYKAEDAR